MKRISILSLLLLQAASGYADAVKDPVNVTVFTNRKSLAQGDEAFIAVSFTMKPGWHIYWKNPGDAGLPTRIVPEKNPDFIFSEVQYPVPARFEQPGALTVYGYHDEAVFLLPARFLGDAKTKNANSATVGLDIHWLNCTDRLCVPAEAHREISWKLGTTEESTEQGAVISARKHIPQRDTAQSGLIARKDGKNVFLELTDKKSASPNAYDCFPGPGLELAGIFDESFHFRRSSNAGSLMNSEIVCSRLAGEDAYSFSVGLSGSPETVVH